MQPNDIRPRESRSDRPRKADHVQGALGRQDGGFERSPGAGIRVPVVIRIAPADFQELRLREVREDRKGIEGGGPEH